MKNYLLLNIDDVHQLAVVGKQIRNMVINTPFTPEFESAVRTAYQQLVSNYWP